MLSSDDLDVMQTFFTLVTCDHDADEAAVNDNGGGEEENDGGGHLINDVLQLLLNGGLV